VPVLQTAAGGRPSLPALAGSASLHGKQLVLTVVNPDARRAQDAGISISGASIRSGRIWTLADADIHAHNSFDHPNAVQPTEREFRGSGSGLVHPLPAASVTRLILDLG
jgi:alpha-L-arabinofuranosidase